MVGMRVHPESLCWPDRPTGRSSWPKLTGCCSWHTYRLTSLPITYKTRPQRKNKSPEKQESKGRNGCRFPTLNLKLQRLLSGPLALFFFFFLSSRCLPFGFGILVFFLFFALLCLLCSNSIPIKQKATSGPRPQTKPNKKKREPKNPVKKNKPQVFPFPCKCHDLFFLRPEWGIRILKTGANTPAGRSIERSIKYDGLKLSGWDPNKQSKQAASD